MGMPVSQDNDTQIQNLIDLSLKGDESARAALLQHVPDFGVSLVGTLWNLINTLQGLLKGFLIPLHHALSGLILALSYID
jgi:hypothetical protein